jgi:hypothetical protein
MEIKEVKRNLNKEVIYKSTKYQLVGCIIRRKGNEFVYQAEIKDLKCNNSFIVCKLEDIQEVTSEFCNN